MLVIVLGLTDHKVIYSALSRSGKKVLHIDRHNYYGGNDAGLSLQDANAWIDERSRGMPTVLSSLNILMAIDESSIFSNAQISTESHSADELATPRLGPSRAYTLTLNPQIIYAQSGLLPSLVSSQIHTQLEFLAVGSWWIHRNGNLQKIPSSREDVFSDDSLSMKDKRGLMKFLRYVMEDEKTQDELQEDEVGTMQSVLSSRFNISNSLQTPLLALALSTQPVHQTDFQYAVSRIRMHLRSMGYFGTGFGAVVAKYGGNAEIAQVACRACAVGGGVYLLGHGVDNVEPDIIQHSDTEDNSEQKLINVTLSSENMIKARFVVGGLDDIPQIQPRQQTVDTRAARTKYTHTISIISDPLRHLFPQTSDNGPVPAAAIVLVEDEMENAAPIYLQVHSEDTGECPSGQCKSTHITLLQYHDEPTNEYLSTLPELSRFDDTFL